jgi:hypothetical protein
MSTHNSIKCPPPGRVFPDDFARIVHEALQSSEQTSEGFNVIRNSCSEQILTSLFCEAFAASMKFEEGRLVRMRILLLANSSQHDLVTLKYQKSLLCDASTLHKLSPTCQIATRYLAVGVARTDANRLEVIGLYDREVLPQQRSRQLGDHFYEGWLPGLIVTIFGCGWIRVAIENFCLELRESTIFHPVSVRELSHLWIRSQPDFETNLPRLSVRQGPWSGGMVVDTSTDATVSRIICDTLRLISEGRHGGCLLIVPNSYMVDNRLDLKYRLHHDDELISRVVRQRCGEPETQDKAVLGNQLITSRLAISVSDRDMNRLSELLAAIANVDGAVVISEDLRILGYGAKISVAPCENSKPLKKCIREVTTDRPVEMDINTVGTRHRSAINFCQSVEGSFAFIVSQDGGISWVQPKQSEICVWPELTADY